MRSLLGFLFLLPGFLASSAHATVKTLREAPSDCLTLHWHKQPLDHFAWRKQDRMHYKQRVFTCEKWWSIEAGTGRRGPIFFYTGNEADVMWYVNNTGLIWENAEQFGALVVFAEHRYYGKSQPFGPDSISKHPQYLTVGQALADFAAVIHKIKESVPGAQDSPVIAFGGSYGGILAAWLRLKYPHLVQGAIAASAPFAAMPMGAKGFNASKFWEVVTYDATPAAGSAPGCVDNVRTAFKTLFDMAANEQDLSTASRLLKLCQPLEGGSDALVAANWLLSAFDSFSMGNYPWPSSYISGDPDHPLPAWPMRAACTIMTQKQELSGSDALESIAKAVGLMYNASGTLDCFNLDVQGPASNTGPWDYQVCTEALTQEQPYMPTNGVSDMFWDQGPYDQSFIDDHCIKAWGVKPDLEHLTIEYGGIEAMKHTSNVVLSNGLYDPWSPYGVRENISDTVVAVIIPEGAHHLDLMFSHPDDPESVKAARQTEVQHIQKWVEQHNKTLRKASHVPPTRQTVLVKGRSTTSQLRPKINEDM